MEVSKELILNALWETLYMVSISLFFGSIIGIFLGILLVVTRKGHIYENRFIFSIVNPIEKFSDQFRLLSYLWRLFHLQD